MERFKTISFDIFDTLLSRRLYSPKDVFSLVQLRLAHDDAFLACPRVIDHFAESRIRAEQEARRHKLETQGGEPEILLADIYAGVQQLHPDLSSDRVARLIELELAAEQATLYPCPEGLHWFKQARQAGAQIILISDMYLDADQLRQLLSHAGYDLTDVTIFSSGEVGVSKHGGELFQHVQRVLDLTPSEWLHIGDNPHSDIASAKRFQISTHHAQWSEYSHAQSTQAKAVDVVGASISQAVKQLQLKNRCQHDPLFEIGFQVFGPLLLGYVAWLSGQFKTHGIDKALFLARDARLIYQLYGDYFGHDGVATEYVFISRASSYRLGLADWPEFRVWYLFGGKSKKSLKKIFAVVGLDAADYLTEIHQAGFADQHCIPSAEEGEKVYRLLNKVFADVLHKNSIDRAELAGYFKQVCGHHRQLAMVDVGWLGNIQAVFARALGAEWASKHIKGFYMATLAPAVNNRSMYNPMFGWLLDYGAPHERYETLIAGGLELMEFAMADNTGTTLGYQKTATGITPIRDQTSDAENEYLAKAARLQQGIVAFFEHYQPIIEFCGSSLGSVKLADPFFQLTAQPTMQQISALAALTHADAAGAQLERLELAAKLGPWKRFMRGKAYYAAYEKSFWKEGFRRLNRRKFWVRFD